MALAATTDARQALLPSVVVARGKTGVAPSLSSSDLAVPGVPAPVGGTDGAVLQPGGEPPRSDLSARLSTLPTAAVSLPSRSGSIPDLLDAADHPPATFVRVPSDLRAVAFRPGNARGIPRRTAIPLFVQSC